MVTMNDQLAENIAFVPIRAQAGYLIGYSDKEYVETLPSFGLPGFQNGTFRAFEVEGTFSRVGIHVLPTELSILGTVSYHC